ncbi:MAG: biotin/lipoyl-binding protein, partial [Beijerinckiaceae bacterium]
MSNATEELRSSDDVQRSVRRHILFGLAVAVGLFGGTLLWSAVTEIAGAVVAPGVVAVESSAKKVQHPEGGIIAKLNVREGDRVQAGDVVARLDDTQLKASLAIVTKALNEMTALEARLMAERDGASAVTFPATLVEAAASNPEAAASMAGQKTIFESRRTARDSARTQLREQITQLESGLTGLTTQQEAREQELQLIEVELKGVRDLFAKNLVPIARVNALERDRARISGDRGKLIADIAASRSTISEKRIQILRLEDDFRSEVVRELADVRNKINEVVERKVSSEDRLARVDIK